MLNYIWFGLMAVALVVAAIKGTAEAVTRGAVESATGAVQIAIGLVGIMTLWLGMMRVAEAAGLVALVGRALRPVLRWLFPEVPPEHPAAGAIVLALAANMLGLNNAATPLGIKAMEELQDLNPDKDTATNAMVKWPVRMDVLTGSSSRGFRTAPRAGNGSCGSTSAWRRSRASPYSRRSRPARSS